MSESEQENETHVGCKPLLHSRRVPLTFGSLFAGIGGFDLGLERAGMVCKWQVEIDEYATRILERHWPTVRRWRDVRTFPPEPAREWKVDVMCGGFPCVDISQLGGRAGISGTESGSGLWAYYRRTICILRPGILLLENTPEIAFRGLSGVLGELAECGYDCAWQSIPAALLGAGHIRNRFFAVGMDRDAIGKYENPFRAFSNPPPSASRAGAESRRETESRMDRVADGVPNRVDRCRCLGNAVVPAVAEWIGRRITEAG